MIGIRTALPSDIGVLHAIDADSCALYAAHGITIDLAPDHVFSRAELGRWLRSAELGRAFIAGDDSGAALGFAALDVLDGEPYLDQLAVRISAMRQGIGGRLIAHAVEWTRTVNGNALWLTTYGHLPFNRPYYERRGFVVVPETECGSGIRHHLDEQRRYLPAPDERVAMRLSV
jgi:GNAT superfamily N-acetyltransferase